MLELSPLDSKKDKRMRKIALNGLGRLGRSIVREGIKRGDVEFVALHDIANGEMLAYLLENDSVHKRIFESVTFTPKDKHYGILEFKAISPHIQNVAIPLFCNIPREELDLSNADVVVESSGKFLDCASMQTHLAKGVKKVIISAPAIDDTPTFVLGVNDECYNNEPIISNASCTTNCLAPIAKILDSEFGIESGVLSTIHSYTYDQNLLDNTHKSDKRRARTAALNIIPTSTGAAKALYKVLPNLKDKLHGHSLRVPVADVSMVDFSVKLRKNPSAKDINDALKNASKSTMKKILQIDERFRVSSDFIDNSYSVIVASDLTFTLPNGLAKIMAWYDNECGYANRILDMAKFIG